MTSESTGRFELPQQMERWLAMLSKVYRQSGRSDLQAIVVNAKIRVEEQTSYDNWNGGTYGHSVYLTVPESVFPVAIDDVRAAEETLCQDLNRVHRVQSESFDSVVLEPDNTALGDWRHASGLLESGLPMPPEDTHSSDLARWLQGISQSQVGGEEGDGGPPFSQASTGPKIARQVMSIQLVRSAAQIAFYR